MTFDQWWATLTDKEQKEIGLHNAKFVWNAAMDECAKACEKTITHPRSAWMANQCITAIRNLKAQTQLFDDWDVRWQK